MLTFSRRHKLPISLRNAFRIKLQLIIKYVLGISITYVLFMWKLLLPHPSSLHKLFMRACAANELMVCAGIIFHQPVNRHRGASPGGRKLELETMMNAATLNMISAMGSFSDI